MTSKAFPVCVLWAFASIGCKGFQVGLYSTKVLASRAQRRGRTRVASIKKEMEWHPLHYQDFSTPTQSLKGRQIAKDDNYLTAVRKAWETEHANAHATEFAEFEYPAGGEESAVLYGHLVRRKQEKTTNKSRVPAIFLFHTAAGPQDIFLFYKADLLLQSMDCVVMVCDIMSDKEGWGWNSDRTQYAQVRDLLMQNNAERLRQRVLSAITSLIESDPSVDASRLASMGWCLGGQPILEMARLNLQSPSFSIQSMVTFHGVFRREVPVTIPSKERRISSSENETLNQTPRVLINNGQDDPFVSASDLKEAEDYFQASGFKVEILSLEGAKHGFTNPAQDFNDNPAFGYNEAGSRLAWTRSLQILKETLAQ